MKLEPRPYQIEAVDSLWNFFKTKTGNPIVALPTGTGKSVIQAMFLESIFRLYPAQKILCLTHVKKLIEQNHAKLLQIWPTAPAGIFSAGLKRKDTKNKIIFGGIASVVRHAKEFGKVHIVIVDEAHLVSTKEESMYQAFFAELKLLNPHLKIIGMTATPWRQKQGKITDDGIFTDICYDITGIGEFNKLIKDGYLCPLVPKRTELLLDVTGVHKVGGDFNAAELQLAVDKDEITYAALKETIEKSTDRNHWLIFASGIDHATNISSMLNHMGVTSRVAHSKLPQAECDANINDWLAGKFTAIVNNGMLTTGIDFPALDLIVMLRPTSSVSLWVQMLGRGTRPFEGKLNTLVLDFAGNTKRLGPINDPVLPRAKGKKTGEAPIRICDHCDTYNHASARYCGGEPYKTAEGCGHEFTFTTKLKQKASSDELIKSYTPIVESFKVDSVNYAYHAKVGKPPMMKVTYFCNLSKFTEYVLFEHVGFGERKAREWWQERTDIRCPKTSLEALALTEKLLAPTNIMVWTNTAFPKIMKTSFDGSFEKTITTEECPF